MENERLAAEPNKVDQTPVTEKTKYKGTFQFIAGGILAFVALGVLGMLIPVSWIRDTPVYECESRWMTSHVKQLKLKRLLVGEDVNILAVTSIQELPGKQKNFVSCMGIGYTNLGTYFLTWSLSELPDKSNWYLEVRIIDADTYILNKLTHHER